MRVGYSLHDPHDGSISSCLCNSINNPSEILFQALFNLLSPCGLVSFVPSKRCHASTLSEHASHCCSFGLGLLISDPLYLLLLRGGGFSAENAAFQRAFFNAAAVLISWVKYSRLRVSWLICGSLSKQVYIFFGKHLELTQAKRRGETTFFRVCLFSMKTSHSLTFLSNFMNHLITFSYTFAQTICDMCILENFLLNSCV